MAEPGNDLDVLFPDRTVTVGGEEVTVHELNFIQGLEAAPLVAPMVDDLSGLFDGDELPSIAAMLALFGKYAAATVRLMAMATGKGAGWIGALTDQEGHRLLMTFWMVNQGFFVSRLVLARAGRQAAKARQVQEAESAAAAQALAEQLASEGYSVLSSPPDTTATDSPITPTAS